MAGTVLPEDLKFPVIVGLCTKVLNEHLELDNL